MHPQTDTERPEGPAAVEPIIVAPRPRRAGPAGEGSVLVNPSDRVHASSTRWLAAILGVLVLLGAIPAMGHLDVATAPAWARLILLIALLQIAYLAWVAILPDWSTVWVVMIVFAAVATLCALGTALAMAIPADRSLPLGLDAVRGKMATWCGASLLLNVLGTYLCGRTSARWRRARQTMATFPNRPSGDRL